jgi:retinol dehydrogenase-12
MAERFEDSIFDALNKDVPEYMADRYNTSKLLEVFAVRSLAEQMKTGPHAEQPVILNMVNPGLCHSALSREISGIRSVIFGLLKLLLARTTEVGSRTLVVAAAIGEESHGEYMSECLVEDPSEFVRSDEGKKTQERVYKELMGILEKIQPGVTKNI